MKKFNERKTIIMKTRSQKLISLVLVLMMLATMIPAGIFSANAAVSAELAAGLADIENTSEFVINNVDDWNAVANTSNQFIGKTIKLGADIDAQGATLPQLFAAGNVRTTFDGQGYAIKNVGTPDAPNMTSLFSNKSNLNVKNLTVDNCHVAGTGNKGILVDWQNCWAVYTFENIKVLNSSVDAAGCAAAIIGYVSGNGGSYGVNFKNILVDGCSISGNSGVAALVGYTYWNSTDLGYNADGIEVVNTTITDNTAASLAAGLFGQIRQHRDSYTNIQNVYVAVTFKTPASSGWTGVDTAVFNSTNSNTANVITMKNILTNCTYSGIVQSTSLCYSAQATYNYENLYHATTPGKSGMLINGANIINGVSGVASNYNAIQPQSAPAAAVQYMITRNADGFVTSIHAPEGLAYELTQYNTISTFTIKTLEDWAMIATSGKNFSNKVVKLGNDIDAKGATLPTLAPLAVDNSSITLDGQGYTIKNVGTATAPQTQPLVAGKFSGGLVKDVTFQNVTMVGANATYGIGLIADWLNGWGTTTVKNVKVLGCNISTTAGPVGALVGRIIANDGAVVTNFDGIIIDADTTITGTSHAGSVIGHISGNGGTHNVNRVYTAATITSPAASAYTGGLVGYACGNAGFPISVFNFTNNVVRGELYADGGSGWTGRIGGIMGRGTTMVNCNVYNNVIAPTAATGGLVLNQVITAANGAQNINVDNCYHSQMFTSVYYAENSSSTLYGVAKASGHWYNAAVPAVVNLGKGEDLEAKIARTYTTDANGFIVNVKDHVDAEAYQVSAVSGGKYAIRFIAASQLAAVDGLKMTVIATYVEGGNTVNRKFEATCELFDALSVYNAQGIADRKSAASLGAEKVAGLTIYNIPTGMDITFTVTTTYTDSIGHVVTGANALTLNFNAAGALVSAN